MTHQLTEFLTCVKCRATSVAKNHLEIRPSLWEYYSSREVDGGEIVLAAQPCSQLVHCPSHYATAQLMTNGGVKNTNTKTNTNTNANANANTNVASLRIACPLCNRTANDHSAHTFSSFGPIATERFYCEGMSWSKPLTSTSKKCVFSNVTFPLEILNKYLVSVLKVCQK